MSKKYLYFFSEGHEAFGGDQTAMKNTLGGKGSGLAEMTNAGMPVPQGFTISTEACTQYYNDGRQINEEITADIFELSLIHICLAARTAHPPADLVQLGQAHIVRVLDDQGIAVAHVHPCLCLLYTSRCV